MNEARKINKATLWLAAFAAIGCSKPVRREPSAAEMSQQVLLKARPKPQTDLGVMFADKVRLLGFDLSKLPLQPGRPFKVTWYWQVEAPLDAGFQLFTHVSDGKSYRMNLDAERLLRSVYPESRWKKGDLIQDEQEVTLPSDWRSDVVVFFTGFDSPSERLPVIGYKDAEGRAEAMRVHVTLDTPGLDSTAPRLLAHAASGVIAVDGELDEPDWHSALSTGAFVDSQSGALETPEARARVLYDPEHLYIGVAVADADLHSTFDHADQPLSEQDAVVVMIDPDGDGKNYFELQVSPAGLLFDARHDSHGAASHVEWDSHAQVKVQARGKLNDGEADGGYEVELAIPWSAFSAGQSHGAAPAAGTTFRINFGVTDAHEAGARVLAWSATGSDALDLPDKLGRVLFPSVAQAIHAAPAGASHQPLRTH
jgi:Carbohydrate family 9 binding domain-like